MSQMAEEDKTPEELGGERQSTWESFQSNYHKDG